MHQAVEATESNIPVEEQTVSMGTMVEDADGLLAAAAEEQSDDMERRLRPRTDSRGTERRYESGEYDWERDATPGIESDREVEFDPETGEFEVVEEGVARTEPPRSPNRRRGETLAAQEKRAGEEVEQERHRKTARDADEAGLERAKATRETIDAESWFEAAPELGDVEVTPVPLEWQAEADLTETLDESTAKTVQEQASRLVDRVDGAPEVGLVRRWIAQKVRSGQDLVAAIDDVHRQVQRWPGAVQAVETVRWADQTATVEGEVTTLWDPKVASQRQVGVLQDDNGDTCKFVIWKKSGKTAKLREGDRVRLEDMRVDVFRGQLALAATSEATIRVIEEGDGPTRFRGYTSSSSKAGDERDHAWANDLAKRHVEKFGASASTRRR